MSDRPLVAVVGDVVIDVRVDALNLVPGGDRPGRVRLRPGGQGANVAAWAATRGRARLHGRVGDDGPGRWLREELAAAGVEPELALDRDAPTGAILVAVEGSDRAMIPDRGANAAMAPGDLPDRLEAGAVFVSGYVLLDPRTRDAGRAALARARGPHVAVDAASWPLIEAAGTEAFLDWCAGATLLLADEREAETLTGRRGEDAARALATRCGRAVVKGGRGGAVLAEDGAIARAEVEPVEPADPTGAGDAFAGVLLASMARGEPAQEALQRASKAATQAVASPGSWPER